GGGADGGASQQPDPLDDVRVAFEGIGETAVVTRLRANLPAAALDRDLVLQASAEGSRPRTYNYGHVLNTPPTPPPCRRDVGPTGVAGGGGCSAAPGSSGAWWAGAALLA